MRTTKSTGKPITAIVLAAGNPSPALGAIFGQTSSAMVPVNGRPIIHWLLTYLRREGIHRVILGLRQTEARLPRFVQQAFGKIQQITCIPISEDRGPGYTLLKCLEQLEPGQPCLVVLGDTLFEFPAKPADRFASDFVLTSPVQDASRWCLAKIAPSKRVLSLADKPAANPDGWPALVGVYYFTDGEPARRELQSALDRGEPSLQLRHALQPYIAARKLQARPAGEWFDCGNLDFLTSSRRRLLQARSFNAVQIDDLHGTITKRSTHTSKFLNEINYYRLVPRDLATFFPRLVDFSLEPKNLFLTLEYYGYPTLSEIWTFEELGGAYWKAVFQSLQKILNCFQQYTYELSPAAVFRFYWQKTVDRIQAFAAQSPEFARLVRANRVELNGQTLDGWPKIQRELENRLRRIAAKPRGQIIHGDLCFPNILYDPLSRLFKFIDPRGSFGESGIYGDGRYDLAKLLHSLDGGYDFLIHDMYSLERDGDKLRLHQFFPGTRPAVLRSFQEVFGACADLREVRALEGLLFLSMCPLHQDHPPRQFAMFATGLRILNELLHHEDMH
ncbi:MAG: NTP transferase domain-containing protein [Verrucomicrobiota bacterium]